MPKKIVFSVGEASGDIHAADLIEQLLQADPTLQISCLGGQHMQKAGANLILDLAQYGVTGMTEVIRHAKTIKKAFHMIKEHLIKEKPDLLILVDYPGFNLRLAAFAKRTLGLKIIYYISPQIWAWKAKRIKIIQQYVDKMAVIFPFEKKIYQEAGVPAFFVGHPLLKKIPTVEDPSKQRLDLNLPIDKKIIALLPGSRHHEVERHLPIMRDAAERLNKLLPHLHFTIPIAKTLKRQDIEKYFVSTGIQITFIQEQAIEVAACSDFVAVASGTASLECALLLKPMCIIYKSSFITYLAANKLIKVKYLGLCNLLQNSMIVPELLQYDCNAYELTKVMYEFLCNEEARKRIKNQLARLKQTLSNTDADCSLKELVMNEI